MTTIIFSLSFSVIALAVLLLFKPLDRRLIFGFGLLFAVYLGLDDFVTGLPSGSASFSFIGGEWNWSGKIFSLLLSAAVILVAGIKPAAIGLTLTQKNLRYSLIVLFLFILWGLSLGLLFQPGVPSGETLAFQALMPGLSEELAYRGIAPAILFGLVGNKDLPEGMPWVVIFITALMFGVWHGLGYSEAGFSFNFIAASFPFVGSIAGGWLRFTSGSLLFPVLGHSAANFAFHLNAHVVL